MRFNDKNGNAVITPLDQILQRVFDFFGDSIRVNTGGVSAQTVAPSDTADLAKGPAKGLYVGGAGNVKVDMADGTTVTLNGLAVGVVHSIAVRRVYLTGTTATNIVAIY